MKCLECLDTDYESKACTIYSNRECQECNKNTCGENPANYGEEPAACSINNPIPNIGCKQCDSDKKPQDAHFVKHKNGMYCVWECDDGFFNNAALEICQECIVLNEDNCPLYQHRVECTPLQDSLCGPVCVNATKPLSNSIWTADCNWECGAGYEAISTFSGVWFCRKE